MGRGLSQLEFPGNRLLLGEQVCTGAPRKELGKAGWAESRVGLRWGCSR